MEKLGERFDKEKTFDCLDVSLGGAWGEGSQDFPKEAMEKLMDIYVRVFPNTKLVGQFANAHLLNYIGSKRDIGWRADGLGSPKHMDVLYPAGFPLVPKDLWKKSPVSFESYWWISEWYRKNWDIDRIINLTLENHMSTFNTKSFPIPYELKDKIEDWIAKMGYHFVINEVEASDSVNLGEKLSIRLTVENVGVAPIYNRLPLYIRLKNGSVEKTFETDVDIREWIEGKYEENLEIAIPEDMQKGEYELQVGIGGGEDPSVVFATDACQDNDFAIVGKVEVK